MKKLLLLCMLISMGLNPKLSAESNRTELSSGLIDDDNAVITTDITLCVDLSCFGSITAPTVFGAFNGWNAGANPITDPDSDGIYCTIVAFDPGPQEFKFFFQEEGPEDMLTPEDDACTITTSGFTNRLITVTEGVTDSYDYGWESCGTTCTTPPTGTDITLCVDLSCHASVTAPTVFGAFNGWNAGANPVVDDNNNGIYCAVVSFLAGPQEYKFFFQEEGPEDMLSPEDDACTITTSGFTNRLVTVVEGVTESYTYGWEDCGMVCIIPPAGPMPLVAAPTPTHDPTDNCVISIYSDAYTDVTGTDFNPNWGQNTVVSAEVIAGDNALKYGNLNYQGTQYASQDVSGLDYIHLDFWTSNSTNINFYVISPGNEIAYPLTIVADQWNSVDIPLSAFVGPVNLADVFQFKVDGTGDVWFDNFYFYKDVPATPAISDGLVGSCESAPSVNSTGSGNKVLITDNAGGVIAAFMDSEAMGNVDASVFIYGSAGSRDYSNDGAAGDGYDLIDRSIVITPATQPSSAVTIFLYYTDAEANEIFANSDGDNTTATTFADLTFTKFPTDLCADMVNPQDLSGVTATFVGATAYAPGGWEVELTVTSFSGFQASEGSAALPIKLKSFTAKADGRHNMIEWTTSSEINVQDHTILKSSDATNWEILGITYGQANSTSNLDYEMVDINPNNTTYYQIMTTDIDGSTSYSPIVSVARDANAASEFLGASPIPTSDVVNLNVYSEADDNLTITLTDISGKTIIVNKQSLTEGNHQLPLDISNLSNGVYLVTIESDYIRQTCRVVKD